MTNHKEGIPLAHYTERFAKLDPAEAAARTGLPFDLGKRAFVLNLMGTEYALSQPDGAAAPDTLRANERILLLRYLCEGRYRPSGGRRLSYHEAPWGNTYYRQFEARVLKRAARAFSAVAAFRERMEASTIPAESIPQSDAGYRIGFLNGFFITLLLYAGDDEFPPAAQMLFDDNFIGAFTAEDMAVAGEILIQRLPRP
jgi:hypothetical protein